MQLCLWGFKNLEEIPPDSHRKKLEKGKTPKSESETNSVVSNSLRPQGLYSPWNSLGQSTGMGSLSFLQGIFPSQGSNPGLPPCSQTLYQLSHKRSPQILECISYMHIPSPVDLPNPGIQPRSPALHVDSLPIELSGKPPKKHPGLANSDMCSETRVNLWPWRFYLYNQGRTFVNGR